MKAFLSSSSSEDFTPSDECWEPETLQWLNKRELNEMINYSKFSKNIAYNLLVHWQVLRKHQRPEKTSVLYVKFASSPWKVRRKTRTEKKQLQNKKIVPYLIANSSEKSNWQKTRYERPAAEVSSIHRYLFMSFAISPSSFFSPFVPRWFSSLRARPRWPLFLKYATARDELFVFDKWCNLWKS